MRGRALSIRLKAQRTRGLESKLVSVGRLRMDIRSPRAHVLQSLTDTCQIAMSIARMQDGLPIQCMHRTVQQRRFAPLSPGR